MRLLLTRNLVYSTRGLGLLLAHMILVAGLATPAMSQTVGGFRSRVPTVPVQEPRALEGEDAESKFDRKRGDKDGAPVAAVFQGFAGNDVSIEVVAGQGRLLTTRKPIATDKGTAFVAVGDPSVVDFELLPNPRMLRITGRRAGVTDLSITTADGQTYTFEVHVVYDVALLGAYVKQAFPDTMIKLRQMREHIIVEGQARDPAQVSQIIQTLQAYLNSVQAPVSLSGDSSDTGAAPAAPTNGEGEQGSNTVTSGQTTSVQGQAGFATAQIINLIRVPGVQQVMLKVQVAELNRTAMREIGADMFLNTKKATLGSQIAGATSTIGGLDLGSATTAFGIFPNAEFEIMLRALRENSVVSILAEPNLMAMSGHEASFLAGGQFPVPVPQSGGAVGAITIEFKDFGVGVNFVPTVLKDGSIRLAVASEVSTIDFSIGSELNNTSVPVLNTRNVQTTVELKEGHTLAVAGLLQLTLDAKTARIPGLGDLPYIGPFFSNTSHKRVEKELVVLVTPYLVAPMKPGDVPKLPGEDIEDPTDCEFYLLNRIEGRTGSQFRSTMSWDDPLNIRRHILHERRYGCGPCGFSE
jgi:pilus assembly protein CpaC